NLRFAENKTSQNSGYGYGVCSDPANAYSKQCAALAPADKGHYLARKYVVDDEKLQNFSVARCSLPRPDLCLCCSSQR
ncbi:hypothetical protein O5964_31225, partial [Escherichia coli]|nr:hypothetical protein [Escherichia coli]